MSTTNSTTQPQPGAGWDEAQCTEALAQLEKLQEQLDDLRLAIPRIIEPFHHLANSMTFKLYAQGVVGSQNGIKNLGDHWKSPEIQNIFEHAKKSLDANQDLAASATSPSRGWVERAQREKESKTKGDQTEDVVGAGTIITDEDISRIISEFQKTYPDIKLELQNDNRSISTQFISGITMTKFRIYIEHEADGQVKFNAECLGTREPSLSITRCISSRPQANDLKNLLDMVAAYKTVKGASCAKCERLLDNFMLIPTARRSKKVSGVNETTETVWEAFHEACLV